MLPEADICAYVERISKEIELQSAVYSNYLQQLQTLDGELSTLSAMSAEPKVLEAKLAGIPALPAVANAPLIGLDEPITLDLYLTALQTVKSVLNWILATH